MKGFLIVSAIVLGLFVVRLLLSVVVLLTLPFVDYTEVYIN